MLDKPMSAEENLGKFILRVTVAGLMLFHGVSKMIHPQSLEFISSMLTNAGFIGFSYQLLSLTEYLLVKS